MTYKLRVENHEGGSLPFWYRFMHETGFLFDDNTIDFYLSAYNAKNILTGPFIEFDTEADAMLFVLRWT